MKSFKQVIVYTSIFIFNLTWLSMPAHAALIGAEALIAAQSRHDAEQKIRIALARDDVGSGLQKLGVSANEIQDRVRALSDDEVLALSDRLEHAPAGGDVFGTIGVIFVILVITDLLGFTKIFPFTRAQR